MINYENLYNILVEFVEQSFHISLYAKVCLRIHKTRCAIEKLQIGIATVVMCHNPCPLVFAYHYAYCAGMCYMKLS